MNTRTRARNFIGVLLLGGALIYITALTLGLVTGAGYVLLGLFRGSANAAVDGTLTGIGLLRSRR